ncbi:MAG: hypothetical protein U0573_11585 [Phycisphaerales bacterium]|nr:hypothetical protein [Planctomycetota bacterium]
MKFRRNHIAKSLLSSLVFASGAAAQTAETGVAPDAGINTADGGSSSNSPFNTGAGTSQLILDRSILDQIPVGCVITSIAFRLDASVAAAWPAAAASFADYEIRLGKAANFASGLSTTFANNVVAGTDVKVRDGLFAPLAGVFPASAAAPNAEAFGPALTFTTPFYYTGGGLVITLRHSGQVGGTSAVLDAHTVPGVGFVFANGQLALNGIGINSTPVVRIGFVRDTAARALNANKLFVGEEFATADGDTGTYSTPFDKSPRTIGTIIPPGELDSFGPGTTLTGFSLRNDESTTVPEDSAWPTVAKNFGNWYLQLSTSQHPVGGLMTDVASNVGADAVDVYNGPLQIPAFAMLPDVDGGIIGTPPAPFSYVVSFQNPYEYRGGPLFMLHRTTGHGQVEDLRTDRSWTSLSQSAVTGTAAAVSFTSPTTTPIFRFDAEPAVIVPNDRATTEANSLTSQILTATDAVYQVLIHEDELRHIPVGSVIDSFALRRAAGAGSSWPDSDVAAFDYEVWLSTAARTPSTMSNTFATNEGADKVQVRDGALGVKANSYPSSGGGPQPYGPAIEFQRGFVYQGGGLCITVRTTGLVGASLPNFTGDLNSTAVKTVTMADRTSPSGAFSAGPAIKLGYIASGVTSGGETTGRRIFDGERTNQIIYSAAALNDIPPGAKITGMSFRNRVTQTAGSYPASNTVLPRFDVALSTATNTPNAMSTTAANNEGADRIDARTGPLTLPAGVFKDSPILPTNDADEFDFYIDFPQAFFYRGGDLCVTIRSESPLNAITGFDVAATNSSLLATMRKDDTNADAAVLGPLAAPPIIRFAYTPPSRCIADLNKDGVVNDEDFQIFVPAYDTLDCDALAMPRGCIADLNFDGVVDDSDFQIFVIAYDALLCP